MHMANEIFFVFCFLISMCSHQVPNMLKQPSKKKKKKKETGLNPFGKYENWAVFFFLRAEV